MKMNDNPYCGACNCWIEESWEEHVKKEEHKRNAKKAFANKGLYEDEDGLLRALENNRGDDNKKGI